MSWIEITLFRQVYYTLFRNLRIFPIAMWK